MQLHKLTLVWDGARMQSARLDPAAISGIAAGAELLLTANAYFYTEGHVPRDGHTGTGHFSIGGGTSSDQPHAYAAWVRVLGSEVYDPATYPFKDQLLGSITAWERGEMLRPPKFARAHAALPNSRYSAIWDGEPPVRTQVVRLSHRTMQAMHMIARPAADAGLPLRVILDGAAILHLGRTSLEQELAEYSRRLRDRGQMQRKAV
jgi:hypothetical protein